jgi:hypothetical protein
VKDFRTGEQVTMGPVALATQADNLRTGKIFNCAVAPADSQPTIAQQGRKT